MQRGDETKQERRRRDQHDQRGVAMVTVLVALVALIAAGALAIDVGLIWAARTQLQNATDAAALAGGANLIEKIGPTVTLSEAEDAVLDQAGLNPSVAAPDGVVVDTTDITYGHWDLDMRTFDPGVDLTDPEQVNAVKVVSRSDGAVNSPVPAFMARILGRDDFAVAAEATAYLGCAGSNIGKGKLDLPIAIDCCELRGSPNCDQDYCSTIETPPMSCPLTATVSHQGNATVSCLEFHDTGDQNACWTLYDGENSSVGASDLADMVKTGYQEEIESLFPIHVSNGSQTSAVAAVQTRMQGGKKKGDPDPAGSDRYPPFDGYKDSWVVGLPVIECQDALHCTGGNAMKMVGFVCFEIREVISTPNKVIKGRFLCPSDPLFEECPIGPTGTGGDDFGIRASFPVLVR